jgi:hypothetical protein
MSASQNPASGGPQPPFSTRGALILLLATCCGVGVGVLTFMAGRSLPRGHTGRPFRRWWGSGRVQHSDWTLMSLWSPGQSGRRRRMAGRECALSRQINRYSTPLDGQRNGCLIDHIFVPMCGPLTRGGRSVTASALPPGSRKVARGQSTPVTVPAG